MLSRQGWENMSGLQWFFVLGFFGCTESSLQHGGFLWLGEHGWITVVFCLGFLAALSPHCSMVAVQSR